MSKLEELLAKQEALTAEIEEAKKQQKVDDLKCPPSAPMEQFGVIA